jgi:hypothetical protein
MVMVVFMAAGTLLTLWGNATLFDAVAVSGTASMFLTPVLIVGLVMGRKVALWGYLVAFAAAILGAFAYFARSWDSVAMILPQGHKYEQLLLICGIVLITGFAGVLAAARRG